MNKFNSIYNLILEELTDSQKKMVDSYTKKRNKTLSFGPIFKEERTYFPIDTSSIGVMATPDEILDVLDDAGYYCPDYRPGYVYKKDDKLKSKPVKLLKILEKQLSAESEQFKRLKQNFDTRLKTNRKSSVECLICITHNPYDVAGMSTDRSWTSCMELDSGAYKQTPLKQVKYGGMCAYLIKSDDKDIKEPIARIAIKRLVGVQSSKNFIFLSEPRIYGDNSFAREIKFPNLVKEKLEESNKLTMNKELLFSRKDGGSYSDAGYEFDHFVNPNLSREELLKFEEYLKKHPTKINDIQWYDISTKDLSEDFIELFIKYLSPREIFAKKRFNEEFLQKLVDKFEYILPKILQYQTVSLEFIERNLHLICDNRGALYELFDKYKFPVEFIDKIEEHLSKPLSETYYTWYVYDNFDKVSDKFIIDNYEKFNWRTLEARLPEDVYEHFKGLKKD